MSKLYPITLLLTTTIDIFLLCNETHYFLDEVDGMTLQHLATVGTSENLRFHKNRPKAYKAGNDTAVPQGQADISDQVGSVERFGT